MSNVTDLFPEDEQAKMIGKRLREQAADMRRLGLDSDSVTSAMLGVALQEMIDRDGVEEAANWLLGIYGRLKGIAPEGGKPN